jgi:choline monooxygenase
MTGIATLPPEWYTDDAVLRRERAAIFAKNWTLFGPAHEVAAPGAWRAETVNGWPLVVVRGADGILRGFHNVCRHRAAALFPPGAGTCNTIRCPYHGWTYDHAGHLLKTPNFGELPGFDPAKHGLFPVRVDLWRDLVFVAIDEAAPDLLAWLGSIPDLCRDFPTAPEMEYFDSFVVTGSANWKAYCDNTVEGYHLPFVHRRLTQAVEPGDVKIYALDDGKLVVFDVGYRNDGSSLRGARGIWFYRFPGFQTVIGERGFKAERIEPRGPGGLKSTSWAWYRDLPQEDRADAFAWAQAIVQEDLGICETVQANFAAGVYRTGFLSPKQETHVARFQALVREALEGEAERPAELRAAAR